MSIRPGVSVSGPLVGEFWAGGGATVEIVGLWEADAVVKVRLRNGRWLKRPPRGVIPLRHFTDGRMHKTDDRPPA